MGKRSRDKGSRGELETVHFFQAAGYKARRSASQSRNGRGDKEHKAEPDVILEDIPEVWIENKRGKVTYPLSALRQATVDAGGKAIPLAICRSDKEPATVTMHLSDFVGFFHALFSGRRHIESVSFEEEPK